ncbi:MAG: amidase [Caldilineaceae bacterium]|nr:amidase [Caldilineaceae bacterium]
MYLHSAPLAETIQRLREDQYSLSLYLEQMNSRIATVNPSVEALLPEPDRLARLRHAVQQLRAQYPIATERPPLYGALVGIKDILPVDGFATQAGSALPADRLAGPEAVVVQQLRAAGALIVGKTVTTEFAYFEPGPTRNPHNLDHTPGGSSSGSAAAVAAGLCHLALGTQTIGSVIRPAAFCGVVGFKPSFDRIATAGLLYFSRTVDHIGLFTQDVAGMQLAASVLCRDWQPQPLPDRLPTLGVPTGPYLEQTEPAALLEFKRQLYWLAEAGYRIKQVPILDDIQALNQLHRRLVFAEFAQEHATLYAEFAPLYRPRTAEIIELGKGVTATELTAARANCLTLRASLAAEMERAGIDLWICPPALGPAPAGIHATGSPDMNLPWTHAGLPAVTVPSGRMADGLPLGLQLVAKFGADEALLTWAAALVQVGAMAAWNK